jgi:hypothetical protein
MPVRQNSGKGFSRRNFLISAASALTTSAVALHHFPRFTAFAQTGCQRLDNINKLWDKAVRPMLSSRYHRLNHVLFHYVRNNWATLTAEQQSGLRGLQWDTPRGAMDRGNWDRNKPWGQNSVFWATTNGSGEDFLYYHRWMIAMVDELLGREHGGPIEPWSGKDAIPPPLGGCSDEVIPEFTPVFENPQDPNRPINVPWLQMRVREMKSPPFFWSKLNWWGQEYRDRASLRTMTLGELGSRLESSVHNQMHIRWSAYPTNGYSMIRDESDFRAKWDDPGYDTLFDEYSSHVGPIFFRLHKWIDDRIEDWAEAHGNEVERVPSGHGFDWFKPGRWVEVATPWTGAWGFEHIPPEEERRRIGVMENATRVMFPPAKVQLRFSPRATEEREEEQRRIISLRDMVM